MGELTTDSPPGGSTPAGVPTAASVPHDPRHHAIGCPECFDDLARFGVAILDFKHPASEGSATWEQRFGRLFETLQVATCSWS
jgi:hypothetical protein